MYASGLAPRKTRDRDKSLVKRRRAIGRAQLVGAAFGLVGGVFSAMLGGVFEAASLFVANEGVRRWLSSAGAILLFLTIPLLIIGGFCMDWVEKNKSRRSSYKHEKDEEEEL